MLFDTHLHLIYPNKIAYPWLSEVPALNSAHSYEDYEIQANRLGIEACFHMEVDVLENDIKNETALLEDCLLYTSPSPRDATLSRMPSSA